KGNYRAAEEVLGQIAETRRGDLAFAFQAYGELADLYLGMKKPNSAKAQFEAALSLADETSATLREDENKLSYLSSLIYIHQKYVDFLLDGRDPVGAFAVAESSRARLLRERLDLSRSKLRAYDVAKYKNAAAANGSTLLTYWIGPKRS